MTELDKVMLRKGSRTPETLGTQALIEILVQLFGGSHVDIGVRLEQANITSYQDFKAHIAKAVKHLSE